MKASVPTLAPLLRSDAQGDLLALLFVNQDSEYSLADIGREIGALPATTHREVQRLVDAEVLLDRMVGRSRLVRVNTSHPLYRPLEELLLLTYGPRPLLTELIAHLDGVEEAYLYGSWAARYAGEPGPPPRDIDLLVVGSASHAAIEAVAREAEGRLRREVNATRIQMSDWRDRKTPFATTIQSRPLVPLLPEVSP